MTTSQSTSGTSRTFYTRFLNPQSVSPPFALRFITGSENAVLMDRLAELITELMPNGHPNMEQIIEFYLMTMFMDRKRIGDQVDFIIFPFSEGWLALMRMLGFNDKLNENDAAVIREIVDHIPDLENTPTIMTVDFLADANEEPQA